MKKKQKLVKAFRMVYLDGTTKDIEIAKCTVIKQGTIKVKFHVDDIGDNKHLIIIDEGLLSAEGKLPDRIEIIRHECAQES